MSQLAKHTKLRIIIELHLIFILFAPLLGGCHTPVDAGFCDIENRVFKALDENHQEWLDYFAQNPKDESYRFTIEGEKREYDVIQSTFFARDNQPVLYVSINDGWPATRIGIRGFIYSPNGETPESPNFQITHLKGNIYCYEQEGDK